jgi:hypothetical protein
MTTAAEIITNALHLFGIVDQTEPAQPADIANNVIILNNLLRAEMADGACQYIIKRVSVTLPRGVANQPYSFSIGIADPAYLVQVDAVAMRSLWMNDINATVNRETRQAPMTDILRTMSPGIITRWHQERQADGSVLVSAFQPPRAQANALIEYGGRLAAITAADGSDTVALPPEGILDAELLLGRKIFGSYGRSAEAVGVVAQDAEKVNARWRDWARGTQWLRFLRS